MLVNRIIFILITFAMMIILSILIKNTVIAGGITFVTVIIGYLIVAYMRSKRRLNLFEESCDPQAFIEATEKQKLITGRNPKINSLLNIDLAAGHIIKGEFNKSKEILLSIDKSNLSVKNGTLLVYTINLISCLYELGEVSAAEKLFETQVPLLPPVNRGMRLSMKILVAERLFILNRYEESKEQFAQLLEEKLSKRRRLGILYILAQIEEKAGDMASAKEKYREVEDNGNKLWIAVKSQDRLKSLQSKV